MSGLPKKTKAIVLGSIKYSESSLITKFYTQEYGLKTFLLKGVRNTKKGSLKSAYFQPLMQLTIVANPHKKGSLHTLKDVSVTHHSQTIYNDIKKESIALFLSEVLSQVIKEEIPDIDLFAYLEKSLLWLEHYDDITNFHLLFLMNLTKFLGFYPNFEKQELPYFDLLEGKFILNHSNYTLKKEELTLFKSLINIDFQDLHLIKINISNRRSLLQLLVSYYELHIESFRKPKSMEVLSVVFG